MANFEYPIILDDPSLHEDDIEQWRKFQEFVDDLMNFRDIDNTAPIIDLIGSRYDR